MDDITIIEQIYEALASDAVVVLNVPRSEINLDAITSTFDTAIATSEYVIIKSTGKYDVHIRIT